MLTRTQVRQHPQVVANNALVELEHADAGRLRQAENPARFSVTANVHRMGAPRLGEHNLDLPSMLKGKNDADA